MYREVVSMRYTECPRIPFLMRVYLTINWHLLRHTFNTTKSSLHPRINFVTKKIWSNSEFIQLGNKYHSHSFPNIPKRLLQNILHFLTLEINIMDEYHENLDSYIIRPCWSLFYYSYIWFKLFFGEIRTWVNKTFETKLVFYLFRCISISRIHLFM